MANQLNEREFFPEKLPIRGEKVSWALTGVSGVTWLIMTMANIPVFWFIPALFILFLFSSLIIRLGNWMDANTAICLHDTGINYKDGLRNISLSWNEIDQIEIFHSTFGKKITVKGSNRRFNFRTLGVVEFKGQVKGRLGFSEGEMILKIILERSHLSTINKSSSGYYYTR